MSSPVDRRGLDELVPRAGLLGRIDAWLGDDRSHLFVITGPPGTGKTWLSNQVVLAHRGELEVPVPHLASSVLATYFCDASDDRTLDPRDFVTELSRQLSIRIPGFADALLRTESEGGTTVVVQATQSIGEVGDGATVSNVAISIPRGLGPRQAFRRLVRRPLEELERDGWRTPVVAVVDDVSAGYTYDATETIGSLLGRVADNEDELPACLRFVVTARPDESVLRDFPLADVDLAAQDETHGEIVRFVEVAITVRGGSLRGGWVGEVAAAAAGNFLYARHVVNELARQGLLDGARAGAYVLPDGLTELYARWLADTVRRDRAQWRSVFTALVVARGTGLTHAQLVGITGLPPSAVMNVIEEARQFLVGPSRGPVRLFHDSFREFLLREELSEGEGHEVVARYFIDAEGGDWAAASEYAAEHLAIHAAAAGRLDELVVEPAFLAVAEPTALLRALTAMRVTADEGAAVDAYRSTAWLLAALQPGDRASHLAMAARERGDAALADRFDALALPRSWRLSWMRTLRHVPGYVLGVHPGVADILAGTFGDETWGAAVSLDREGEVRVWDLRTHDLVRSIVLPDHTPNGRLAGVMIGGSARLVVVGADWVGVVDIDEGAVTETIALDVDAFVSAVAAAESDGHPMLYLGWSDGTVRALDLGTGDLSGPGRAHEGPVSAIVAVFSDALLTAGLDGRIASWEPDSGQTFLQYDGGSAGWVGALAALRVPEGPLLTVCGDAEGDVVVFTTREDDTASVDISAESAGDDAGEGDAPGGDAARIHAAAAVVGGYVSIGESRWSTHTWTNGPGNLDQLAESHARAEDEADRKRQEEGKPSSPPATVVRAFGGVDALDVAALGATPLIASGGADGRVAVRVGRADGTFDPLILHPQGDPVGSVAFSALDDDRMVVISAETSRSGRIRMWPVSRDAEFADEVGEFAHAAVGIGVVSGASAEAGDGVCAVVHTDGTAALLAAPDGSVLMEFDSGIVPVGVCGLRRRGDPGLCVYGRSSGEEGDRGILRIALLSEAGTHTLEFAELDLIEAVLFDDDGGFLLAGRSHEGADELWGFEAGDGAWTGRRLASGLDGGEWLAPVPGLDGAVAVGDFVDTLVIDSRTGSLLREVGVWTHLRAPGVVFDGRPALLVELGANVDVHFVDDEGGVADSVYVNESRSDIQCLAASADASLVVAGTELGVLVVWRAPGLPVLQIEIGSPIQQVEVIGAAGVAVRTDTAISLIRIEE